mmetsp:Transcript_56044/g.87228  ORF Transcript_56044/g.87228 Transcript_56044/m.87228 type:complete len:299 (+) Transcript_56044:74-970(+)
MSALADGGPSKQSIILGVASAAALASALWIVWPRRPKASHDALLKSLKHLRAEYAAVYAEVSSAVVRSGLPSTSTTSLSSLAAVAASSWNDSNESEDTKEESGLQKLAQVLEQPLILDAALREASDHAASDLLPGGKAHDLESTMQHFANDSDVKESVDAIHDMHRACLVGEQAAPTEIKRSKDMWSEENVLDMLRVLGQAKCAHLENLKTCLSQGDDMVNLGVRIIEACAQAEDQAWDRKFGIDSRTRRCLFRLALESYSMERSFGDRRAALESELEDAVAAIGNDLMAGLPSGLHA